LTKNGEHAGSTGEGAMSNVQEKVIWSAAAVAMLVIAVTAGYVLARPESAAAGDTQRPPVPASAVAVAAPTSFATSTGAAIGKPNVGESGALRQTTQPTLPLDKQGQLQKTREVRDFFDYFLTAQSEQSPQALDAQVSKAIDAQLGDMPARAEAANVWERYKAYRVALAQLKSNAATPGSAQFDPAALRQSLDERASMAAGALGEWLEPFFGRDLEGQRYSLARMQIERDKSLSDSDKTRRLQALEDTLSPEQRSEAVSARQQAASLDTLVRLSAQTGSDDSAAMQEVAQQMGQETAARFASTKASERGWQDRYASYAKERDVIRAQYTDQNGRQTQIDRLRNQYFPASGDALRASSLDDAGQ
jgi:lipase chaperone LimK